LVCKLHSLFMNLSNLLVLDLENSVTLFKLWNERNETDHSTFYCHTSLGKCVYLILYVDDIVIKKNNATRILQLKEHLCNHFQTKDLGSLKYILGTEVAQLKEGIIVSQRKYTLDILEGTSTTDGRLVDSPTDSNKKLMADQGETLSDPERYRRPVEKLIYLTITRVDLSFAVGVLSQFMQNPCIIDHWNAIIHILRYLKKTPRQGLSYKDKGNTQISRYCDANWAISLMNRRFTTR